MAGLVIGKDFDQFLSIPSVLMVCDYYYFLDFICFLSVLSWNFMSQNFDFICSLCYVGQDTPVKSF